MEDRSTEAPTEIAAQADLWAYADPSIAAIDLHGYSIEARDGAIGRIDRVSDEFDARYVVVDTGPWLLGKKVLLPAGVIERIDPDTETVLVDRTKDEIRNAPPFDESTQPGELYRTELGDYYIGRRRLGPGQL